MTSNDLDPQMILTHGWSYMVLLRTPNSKIGHMFSSKQCSWVSKALNERLTISKLALRCPQNCPYQAWSCVTLTSRQLFMGTQFWYCIFRALEVSITNLHEIYLFEKKKYGVKVKKAIEILGKYKQRQTIVAERELELSLHFTFPIVYEMLYCILVF